MREIFLIARREYLAYVSAWGFWLQIIILPVFMVVGGAVGGLATKSDPVRAFAVIDPSGQWTAAIDGALKRDVAERTEDRLDSIAETAGLDPALEEQAIRAFRAAPDPQSGLAAWRATIGDRAPAAALAGAKPAAIRFRRVAAPASDIEGLKPYLLGQTTIAGAKGPEPLFAALVLEGASDHAVPGAQYWSTNLTNPALRHFLADSLRDTVRERRLGNLGVGEKDIAALNELTSKVEAFDPSKPAAASGDTNKAAQAVTWRDRLPFFVAMILTYVLWSSVLGVANSLLTGVMEERSSKILDTLMTSVGPQQILIGKLCGVAAVSLTLLLSWGVMAAAGGVYVAAGGAADLVQAIVTAVLSPTLITAFVLGFVFGYMMYGAIYLALGSLCETLQEAQSLMTPIVLVMMTPLIVMVFAITNPDLPWIRALSWVPLFTPFLVIVRAPAGLAPGELAGMIALLIVTAAIVLFFASRVFHAGAQRRLSAADVTRFLRPRLGRRAKDASPEA